MELQIYKSNTDLYVELVGRVVLDECDRIKQNILPLIDASISQMHLDLSKVEFIDSAGLGILVGLKMTTNKNKSRLILVAPSRSVHDILSVSKLDAIFDIMTGPEAGNGRNRVATLTNLIRRVGKGDEQAATAGAPRISSIPAPAAAAGAAKSPPGAFAIGGVSAAPAVPQVVQEPQRASMVSPDRDEQQDDATHRQIDQFCRDAVDFMRQGDYDHAAESYIKALGIDPEYLPAHNNLAIVYEKKPTWHQKAIDQWERVLELAKKNGDPKHMERASKHLANLRRL